MSLRALPTALALSLLALAGCDQGQPGAAEFQTTYGHSLDSRAWAVGTRVELSASTTGVRRPSMQWEGAIDDSVGAFGGYLDEGFGGMGMMPFAPPPIPGQEIYGYTNTAGIITAAGDFSAVVLDKQGVEIDRVDLVAEEPDSYTLGVLLDNCPEFADLIYRGDPGVIEGSEILVAPVPLDADGNQLLGHFDFTVNGTGGLNVTESWGTQAYVQVEGSGTLEFVINGESHEFLIQAVPASAVTGLGIHAQAEKHGGIDQSLLSASGVTDDGLQIHGLPVEWDGGFGGSTGQTSVADNGSTGSACFGGLCTDWTAE